MITINIANETYIHFLSSQIKLITFTMIRKRKIKDQKNLKNEVEIKNGKRKSKS